MRLAGICFVLKRFAGAAQRIHPFLGAFGRHHCIVQAVQHQHRLAHLPHFFNRRGSGIHGAAARRMANHHFGIQAHIAVALRPRAVQVGIAVAADAAREQVVRVAREAARSHVATVAAAADANALRIYCGQRTQQAHAGQTVLHVAVAPVVVVGMLKLRAITAAAAEVGRKPGVALGHKVLRNDVPIADVL